VGERWWWLNLGEPRPILGVLDDCRPILISFKGALGI